MTKIIDDSMVDQRSFLDILKRIGEEALRPGPFLSCVPFSKIEYCHQPPDRPDPEAYRWPPPVETTPVLRDDRQITVWFQGVLYGLVRPGPGRETFLACERLAEGIIAPDAWEV